MKLSFTTMATGAAIIFLGFTAPTTGHAGPVDVNIQLNGYLPAPPGVHIYYDAGRPYYVENHKRVYMKEKRKGDHDHGKKIGHKKHHRD